MIQRFIFLLFLCGLYRPGIAQKVSTTITYSTNIPEAGNKIIGYDPALPLTVSDFKGTPNENSRAAAITNTGFSFTAGYSKKGGVINLTITLFCNFNRELSWMKEVSRTPYILAHEQRHFDICYLSTMRLLQQLRNTSFTEKEYRQQLDDLYNTAVKEMDARQELYDRETNHGTFTKQQGEWNTAILGELQALKVNW